MSSCCCTDLNAIASNWDAKEAAYFLFKEKQWGPSNWIFITYIPDSGPVQQRTVYGSAIEHLRAELGRDKFGSDKRCTEISEVTWNHVKGLGGGNNDKPWSKREIAQQELNAAENVARQEASTKPLPASGFHTASYPLTSEATSALDQLKSGQVNWVQLSLDASRKNMTSVASKQVSTNELSSLIDEKEPQFYLYNTSSNTLVLIYCCPEQAPQKNRMVYSTCKASLAETLKQSGVSVVKKYDIREASEMTINQLNEALRSASSSLFRPDERTSSPHTKASSYGSSGGQFDHSQFQSNKPVFNRSGLSHAHSSSDSGGSSSNKAAKPANMKSPAPLAQAMGLASNSGRKSIVVPPRGAYE